MITLLYNRVIVTIDKLMAGTKLMTSDPNMYGGGLSLSKINCRTPFQTLYCIYEKIDSFLAMK